MFNFFRDLFHDLFGRGAGEIEDFGRQEPRDFGPDFDEEAPGYYDNEELSARLVELPEGMDAAEAPDVDAEVATTKHEFLTIEEAMEYCEPAPLNILKIYITPDGEIEVWRFPS